MKRTPITTDRQLAALVAEAKPYEVSVAKHRGLIVRVFPVKDGEAANRGTKLLEFRYVSLSGVRRRLPLGSYPDVSLKAAQDAADIQRAALRGGKDPWAILDAEKAEARTGDTVEAVAEKYFTAAAAGTHGGGKRRKKAASSIAMDRSRFNNHIKKKLGRRKVKEVTRRELRDFVRDLTEKQGLAPSTAMSVRNTLGGIFGFAAREGVIDASPATGLADAIPEAESRARMFDDDAVAALWRALEAVPNVSLAEHRRRRRGPASSLEDQMEPTTASTHEAQMDGGSSYLEGKMEPAEAASILKEQIDRPGVRASVDRITGLALQFALLTLARRADVTLAEWSEIDLKQRLWTIPAARFKSRREHVVPLSEPALTVLRDAKAFAAKQPRYVFPSPADKDRPIDGHALTRALARTLADLKLPHGSPHDFRRSGATTLTGQRYGVRQFFVGKVLGHSTKDGAAVTGIYDRNQYEPEKRSALNAWAGHVLAVAAGTLVKEDESNVRQLRPEVA